MWLHCLQKSSIPRCVSWCSSWITCCGYGVLEVKCPFSAKEAESLWQVAEQQKDFCLQLLPSKSLKLSTNHPYYLQCQLQIYTTRRSYCDFVVWHPAGLHIERLTLDNNHLRDVLHKAELFFYIVSSLSSQQSGSLMTVIHLYLQLNLQMSMMRTMGDGVTVKSQREVKWWLVTIKIVMLSGITCPAWVWQKLHQRSGCVPLAIKEKS